MRKPLNRQGSITGRRTHRRYRASNNSTNIWSVAYGYDADDNIASITDLVDATRSLSFQYDGVDRLARVDTSAGASASAGIMSTTSAATGSG